MIKNLDVRLYKKTAIYSDGKEVDFPFMKAILLMIILCDKKIHSKKKLQLMLWFDKNEQKADRNLRNTIYVIKQKLGSDVIITEKNSMIRLNENIKVSNDLDLINDIDYEDMDLYDLENTFLHFKTEPFEDINFEYGASLDEFIRNIKEIFTENIYRKLSEMLKYYQSVANFENVIATAKFMLTLYEYDEYVYDTLMSAYKLIGMVFEAIKINDRKKEIFGLKDEEEISVGNSHYRDKEVLDVLSEIGKFKENKRYRHIGIKGLGGSGKTEIIGSIKMQKIGDVKVIHSKIPNGYIPPKGELFNLIMDRMRASFLLDSSYAYETVAKDQKVILIIDNLDLSDNDSMDKIFNFIIRSVNRVILIATYSNDFDEKFSYFLNCLLTEGIFTVIELKNLKYDDLKNVYKNLSKEQLKNLISRSGGNPFLINYLLNNGISNEMYDAFMKVNLSCKSELSLKILKILSLMIKGINIFELSSILQRDSDSVIKEVSNLLKRSILIEDEEIKPTGIKFYNDLQKEYISGVQTNVEKEFLHEKIAKYYESKLCSNYSLDNQFYYSIIHHFTMAKNVNKAFIYKCRQFNEMYNISHEFFPIALDEEYTYISSLSTDEIFFKNRYKELITELEDLSDKYSENIVKIRIDMYFSYARFFKSIGKFEEAEGKLSDILKISSSMGYFNTIFNVHMQFIQNAINTNDLKSMRYHLNKVKDDCSKYMDEVQRGIFLRFNGYCEILNHNFDSGEKQVEEALKIFKNQYEVYKMKFNIAACNFILGESKSLQDELDYAFDYYLEAISICHDREVHPSLALLFSRLGMVKLKQKSYDESKYYLEKSLKQYENIGFLWGKEELYKNLEEVYNILKNNTKI